MSSDAHFFTVFVHSFDYESAGYQAADLIKMDFLLNGRPVEELTTIVHRYVSSYSWKIRFKVRDKFVFILVWSFWEMLQHSVDAIEQVWIIFITIGQSFCFHHDFSFTILFFLHFLYKPKQKYKFKCAAPLDIEYGVESFW